MGEQLKSGLLRLQHRFPQLIRAVRGLGLMLGVELASGIGGLTFEGKAPSIVFTIRAQQAGLLVIPAGQTVFRLLPALNLTQSEAEEGLQIIESLLVQLA
jgi:4-aminobutyrate aminotransferase-like enzyme